MGVSYKTCDCCKDARYEEFVARCESCGNGLCVSCMTNTEGVEKDDDFTYPFSNEDGYVKAEHCPFCEGEKIEDAEFLRHLAAKHGLDLEKEKSEFREEKRKASQK